MQAVTDRGTVATGVSKTALRDRGGRTSRERAHWKSSSRAQKQLVFAKSEAP